MQSGLNVVFQQSVALATKIMFDFAKDAFHSCLGWQALQQLIDGRVPCCKVQKVQLLVCTRTRSKKISETTTLMSKQIRK